MLALKTIEKLLEENEPHHDHAHEDGKDRELNSLGRHAPGE
jgi:hypothetical protein